MNEVPFCVDCKAGWNHCAIMVEAELAQMSVFVTAIGNDFWQMHPFLPKNDRQERSSNWKEFGLEISPSFSLVIQPRFNHLVIMIATVLMPKNIWNTIWNWSCLPYKLLHLYVRKKDKERPEN